MTALGNHIINRPILKKIVTGLSIFLLSWAALGCTPNNGSALGETSSPSMSSAATSVSTEQSQSSETAIFAGGCFWCMEHPFDELPGVTDTISGYTGGTAENPTYTQVSNGNTGHVEAMQVTYDPTQVSYETLLTTFWHNIDPLDNRGQFCDKGSQYRSAIFYDTPEQAAIATESKAALANNFERPVATDILPADTFYSAEDYHQNYYQTHPVRYKVYRFGCGRDQRLSELWGADAPGHD
ncbi:MAG: peptide-methionine (S)-S-oxide reductase MsrA [Phormidesmis sp.]